MLELLNTCIPEFHLCHIYLVLSGTYIIKIKSIWILQLPIHSDVEDQFHCITLATGLYGVQWTVFNLELLSCEQMGSTPLV